MEDYPDNLRLTLESVAPEGLDREPTVVVLTPGIYNSAYFEHSFLADQMGVELVEGQDLVVVDGALHDEDDAGPEAGRRRLPPHRRRLPRSARLPEGLGARRARHLRASTRAGRLTIVNAPGAGIADDKSIYTYMPDIIEFYTGRPPILKNVPTYVCRKPDDLKYVLEHLAELVVKQVHGSGGYGMLVGPTASRDEIDMFRMMVKARPDRYIAQPTLALSTCPTLVEAGIAAAPPRPAPLRADRRPRAPHPRRPHPRRPARRLPGRQLEPGRRHQGHLGAAGLRYEGSGVRGQVSGADFERSVISRSVGLAEGDAPCCRGLSAWPALPKAEEYRLTSQLLRAAASVPANIAEGHAAARGRTTPISSRLRADRSQTTETILLLLVDVGLLTNEHVQAALELCSETGRMLNGLLARLRGAST